MKRSQLRPGAKIDRWTVIRREGSKNGHRMFLCACECGEAAIVRGSSLLDGSSHSCGCIKRVEPSISNCSIIDNEFEVEQIEERSCTLWEEAQGGKLLRPLAEKLNMTPNRGVYMLLNVVNLYAYIGSSTNLKKRVKSHFKALKNNKHSSKHLQEDFNKYGQDKFVFIVLDSETEDLLETEKAYLQLYPFKYNIQYMEIARTAKVKIPKTSKIQPGVKYNKWTVLEETRRDKRGLVEYHCICECGNDRYVRGTYLKDGKSTSCGCIRVKNLKYKGIKVINDEAKSSLPKDLPEEAVKTIKKIYSGVTL
jgi:predicted GIY-YIG superfamily endonuclease